MAADGGNDNVELLYGNEEDSARKEAEAVAEEDPLADPPCLILPRLYLGSLQSAAEHYRTQFSITHVVDAAWNMPSEDAEKEADDNYFSVHIDDTKHANMTQHFERVIDFVHGALSSGGVVLIHCMVSSGCIVKVLPSEVRGVQCGVSRSSTLLLAYLLRHTEMSLLCAYRRVRRARRLFAVQLRYSIGHNDHRVLAAAPNRTKASGSS